ncbi:MAG: transcriptional accessory protein Tex [Blastopirellula sp.]|nr:MAG: transcriptional accessory protein Tex [Blastopirellula sp.]
MDTTVSTDLNIVAREVGLPIEKVQRSIDLLDDGNTVPFITRYRKDETGGLDEEQIRSIHEKVEKLRQLNDRKQTILKSILSQEKLTDALAAKIRKAPTQKLLEDLYLPFKPKKQSLATQARQRGLQPLAEEILSAAETAADLQARAAEFVDAEKGLADADAVLQGVGHLVAEGFSENAILRGRLRKLIWKAGILVSTKIEQPAAQKQAKEKPAATKVVKAEKPTAEKSESPASPEPTAEAPAKPEATPAAEIVATTEAEAVPTDAAPAEAVPPTDEKATASQEPTETPVADSTATDEAVASEKVTVEADASKTEAPAEKPAEAKPEEPAKADATQKTVVKKKEKETLTPQQIRREKRQRQKERERAKKEKAFKDYYNYREPVAKIPPHRVLAINRGDKTQYLRVKIEISFDQVYKVAVETLIAEDHPHIDYLKQCVRDALTRLLVPSLEREVRRELTEKAEVHAVGVFACNLRKLLLQPPVHNKCVLAIDPGFRSGCKLAVLDQFGNLVAQGLIHLIGADDRVAKSKAKLAEMIRKHKVEIIAIGNGTACRETEDVVASLISEELKELDLVYLVVNEAGASVYSTSELGREEFPEFDATVRGTISIGRRLLDPLSELVKINPSNIGVGLYQHDVKSKHLQASLDGVVESGVNYVGVDVNKASPALLSYVSGLNQLTARRIYEYRLEHGPFKSREEFKKVPGFGDKAFIQAAGFLKIQSPENPLDATWIHPESYESAEKVLEKLGCSLDQVLSHLAVTPTPVETQVAEPAPVAAEATSAEATTAETIEQPKSDAANEVSPTEEVTTDAAVETVKPTANEAAETASTETASTETASTETASTETASTETASTDSPSTETEAEEKPAKPASAAEPVSAEASEPTPVPEPVKPVEVSPEFIPNEGHKVLVEKISAADASQLATELAIGEHLAKDLLNSLSRPGRDPRADFPPPLFRRGVMKLEDLEPGMELSGSVLNVVDFGAFVDIGLHDSGMVHISRLANKYVTDPHEVVSVGDILKVWVISIDKDRRRVSLTAIEPGTEKPEGKPAQRRSSGPKRGKPNTGQKGTYSGAKKGTGKPAGRKFTHTKRPSKPKPQKPITEEMKKGEEPMRSFGDLQQFLNIQKDDKKKKKK